MKAAYTSVRVRPGVVLVGLLALALNLRTALAGYPPLIDAVRADLGFSAGAAGFVQTGAVLMMAAGSLAGPAAARRGGPERALVGAVGLVALGSLVRGVPAAVPLVTGSLLAGFGIGVAGVLLTGVVKEHLADRAGAVTGGYVVAMMIPSTVASAVAVPLAAAVGGWSLALAVWAVPAVLALAAWVPVARRVERPAPTERARLPWRDRFARLAATHQSAASLLVYGWMTWLAPYLTSRGWSPRDAGMVLAVWAAAQVPGALAIPALAERTGRWRFWSGVALASTAAGTIGLLLAPLAPVVGPWPWAVLVGLGSGAGFPLGLAVVAWRTPDAAASAATSGMALGVGYTVAGIGPFLMGLLIDLTAGYAAAIGVLVVAAAVQASAIIRIGDAPRAG
ncbi:CP family cyanate transporter-like MFS transporter [Pseudonocardia hierapolitana]|uniref:CP family cyanate transporter-like MFS transporter n=1 Tax=Pseudonocardia hierapolitana TaxID=1128676 RepID=A0A561T3K6_9PSEU|nr:MFS transporter [Pseudonocardia hierapolitana]TWF81682.1 CP family cyanate transporter-like MFS transporter [Pseudonocardia hierapolitana]